jgi:hypothetical protein
VLVIVAEVWGPKMAPVRNGRSRNLGPSLLAQAFTGVIQPPSPSAQVKAAFVQVGHCNWNLGKKILSPTIGVR